MRPIRPFLPLLLAPAFALAQTAAPDPVSIRAPVIALTHVRVIDGLGHAPVDDQTLVITGGRIAAVGAAAQVEIPAGAAVRDLAGKTVLPGFVLVHEHLYYSIVSTGSFHVNEMEYSFPRLYLAAGITSARTTGCIEPDTDLEVKTEVDAGKMPGPKLHLTSPYFNGPSMGIVQMHDVGDAAAARRKVNFWADEGFTSVKVYTTLSREVMAATIAAAHARGLQVTGHIGTVSYREAAEAGIDNLEHGFLAAADFIPGRKTGDPSNPLGNYRSLETLNPDAPEVDALIRFLIEKHVAITSTLAIFETFTAGRRIAGAAELEALAPPMRDAYLTRWAALNVQNNPIMKAAFAKDLVLERKFFRAGGRLVVGTDPTGYGGCLAGYGSWRAIELLVEAGLTPLEALQVATANGAKLLGIDGATGSIAPGLAADLVVVAGDPSKDITDIRKAETVFKDGVGYDSKLLFDSVKGQVGIH